MVLVGNKSDDTANRKVTYDEAWKLCEELGCLAYYETSARDAINVDDVFYTVAA